MISIIDTQRKNWGEITWGEIPVGQAFRGKIKGPEPVTTFLKMRGFSGKESIYRLDNADFGNRFDDTLRDDSTIYCYQPVNLEIKIL
jgi:hypothetical protein